MPESAQLNTWVAESGSWQSFIDFKLPDEYLAGYSFIESYDDFYLSLMARAIELINNSDFNTQSDQLLSTAKGLEIFSLKGKAESFAGVNRSENLLYAAGLYLLANYSASAWILSKIYPKRSYETEIDVFVTSFLRRELNNENFLSRLLNRYLKTGNAAFIKVLLRTLKRRKDIAFDNDVDAYFSYLLAEALLQKFAKDNIWIDLLNKNKKTTYWQEYVTKNIEKKVPVWTFFPSQKSAIQNGVLSGKTCSLQMPTSSGKTSISELIIYDEFQKNENCKILYLAPYRALASELKQSLATSLASFGISSKTIFGGNLPTLEERKSVSDVNLVIATPEKFMAVEDIFPGISEQFTTVICDEGHLLDDASRGLNYELLLSRLKSNSTNKKRFIFISAIIPNISTVNSWLGGDEESLVYSNYRPTELEFAFLRPMTRFSGYYLDVNPYKKQPDHYQLYKYLVEDELIIKNGKKKPTILKTQKSISVATALKATMSGTVALFAPAKGGNTGVIACAADCLLQITRIGLTTVNQYSDPAFLDSLVEYFAVIFGDDYLLTKSAALGFLYHTGDFPQNIREVIEDALRQGKIRLVICTNTLAEGVNLPIKTIVIHSTTRYDETERSKKKSLRIRDLKNLVGRAGRAGKETKGLVIVAHQKDFDTVKKLILEEEIEPVKGELFDIVQEITTYLKDERLQMSQEVLDSLGENLQELLDSIDVSMIDLLSEEVEVSKLNKLVAEHIKETLSYYQSNEQERTTLTTLFEIRAEKLKPIIEAKQFRILKHSGANIRLFEEVTALFDFENEIWDNEVDPLNEAWLDYILDEGVFKLDRYSANLITFNKVNKIALDNADVKLAIIKWMKGDWYYTISESLGITIDETLRLINGFISFNIQNVVSATIRLKELKTPNYSMPASITNWSSFLQHGIKSQWELDLIEMGLIDRVAVIELFKYLERMEYNYIDYNYFKSYLISNSDVIPDLLQDDLPSISFDKLSSFLEKLKNQYLR